MKFWVKPTIIEIIIHNARIRRDRDIKFTFAMFENPKSTSEMHTSKLTFEQFDTAAYQYNTAINETKALDDPHNTPNYNDDTIFDFVNSVTDQQKQLHHSKLKNQND